ncbi:hypothetical protein [Pyxidicoccus sp. MSG2]|uniref:hypothetical protein n=1 Tax=Pyxidicoccus sp. MSG2 TaxID=2996790 RepID=UPI00227076FA|nr:hypothetical protein [Pyxidicoccus sp. MSG2]MCY1021716.1 hypothetical protein [Pyxidicoccus sp. MSG2]
MSRAASVVCSSHPMGHGRAGPAGVLSELSHEDLHAYEAGHGLAGGWHTHTAMVPDAGRPDYVSTDAELLFADSRRLHGMLQAMGRTVCVARLSGMVAGLRTMRIRALSQTLSAREQETQETEVSNTQYMTRATAQVDSR